MSKKRTHPRNWSDEELAILRREWNNGKAVRFWLDLLPNRTERAIIMRGLEMGLGPRGCKQERGHSATWHAIERELSKGRALSSAELVERTGFSRTAVYAELRMHYPGKLHIGGYGPRVKGAGYRPKLWKLGAGKDAPRPKAMTQAERARKRWRMLKEERPDYIAARNAKHRLRDAEKKGKLIRRDPAAAWL